MEERKLEIIQQLMEELQGLMEPGADDLGERLGRPKVEVAIESEEPIDGMPADLEEADMEMGPEDKLKERILKMRG
jgi:hypothetical protein